MRNTHASQSFVNASFDNRNSYNDSNVLIMNERTNGGKRTAVSVLSFTRTTGPFPIPICTDMCFEYKNKLIKKNLKPSQKPFIISCSAFDASYQWIRFPFTHNTHHLINLLLDFNFEAPSPSARASSFPLVKIRICYRNVKTCPCSSSISKAYKCLCFWLLSGKRPFTGHISMNKITWLANRPITAVLTNDFTSLAFVFFSLYKRAL